jgi:hypothetical protein
MRVATLNNRKTISRDDFARDFVVAYDQATKIMQGKLHRSKVTFQEKLKLWQKWAEE